MIEFRRRHQPIVAFLNDFHLFILDGEFEKCNCAISHELRRNCTASHSGKSIFDKGDVLTCLDHANLVVAALCLNRDSKMAPMSVESNIEFIDLDLTDSLNGGAQVVL